jgi:type IX secretion system substrate protein
MNRIVLLTALIFVKMITYGQQVWEQKYDDKVAQTFTSTLADKYIIAGSEYESMQQRWHIFQTDLNGNIEWDTTFLHGSNGFTECIEPTEDSGYVVAGYAGVSAYFLKYDKDNVLNWESKIETSKGGVQAINSIISTPDKGFIATGDIYSPNIGLFLVKIDEYGDSIWTKKYFSDEYGHGLSLVKPLGSSSYYCLAMKSYARTLLLKIDEQGDTIWSKNIYTDFHAISMITTSDTNLVISAHENSRNLVFAKVDLNGNIIWEKKYYSAYTYNYCNHFSETQDKGFITANYMEPLQQNESNLWIMKLNEQGDSLFSITSTVQLRPEKILETNDNLYVFLANDKYQRPRLIKTDETGDVITSFYSSEQTSNISYYPNPVQDKLIIKLDKTPSNKGFYRLYNSSGVLIKENELNQSTTIDMSNFNTGIYILNLIVDNEIISKKILK